MNMQPKGPYTLAPERAKRLIGRMVDYFKEEWTIIYLQNAERELILWLTSKPRRRCSLSDRNRGREGHVCGAAARCSSEYPLVLLDLPFVLLVRDRKPRRCYLLALSRAASEHFQAREFVTVATFYGLD
jgi:hypothetical protein